MYFGKVYSSEAEKDHRKEVFTANQKKLISLNSGMVDSFPYADE